LPEEPHDLQAMRREKLQRLLDLGINPYPHSFRRTHTCGETIACFEQIEEQESVAVAGRLRSLRPMGKAAFGHIEDASGKVQLYLRKDILGPEAFGLVKQIDLGDFVGARGRVFRTQTGEISVRVEELTILAKALRPMPVVKEKDDVVFDAFTDREARYRTRYLDLMVNRETRALFARRAAIIQSVRRYLDQRGFLEVETPILQQIYGGGSAVPFKTHHRSMGTDLYLRIAEELPLKKLIVGGLERVYEIGRVFRNEGVDREHNPEFTLLEFYWAYADYNDAMDLVEDLLRATAREVCGELALPYGRAVIQLEGPFERRTMLALIEEVVGHDVRTLDAPALADLCARLGSQMDARLPRGKLIEKIFDLAVVPRLIQPTFVIDHPKEVSPLAKSHREHPDELVERFELFMAGMEFANAFTELNDPIEQRRRFDDQARRRAEGDEEAQPLDEEFLAALEQGMPPTAGVGIGIDRLVMLLTGSQAIRDVLLFPHMRPLEGGSVPAGSGFPPAEARAAAAEQDDPAEQTDATPATPVTEPDRPEPSLQDRLSGTRARGTGKAPDSSADTREV
jgi:lysyl-tRNA synthetase, class II